MNKLLVVGHDLKFLGPLLDYLQLSDDFELKLYNYEGHQLPINDDLIFLAKWANVVFCEWALGNAEWFSKHIKPTQKLIVRLHSQELRSPLRERFLEQIDWSNIDSLIFISPYLQNEFSEFGFLSEKKCIYIPNPIAHGDINYHNHLGDRFTLGLVGVVPAMKRLDLGFDLIRRLHNCNKNYRLIVKGKMPNDYAWMVNRPKELGWYEKLFLKNKDLIDCAVVTFEPFDMEMSAWYQKIGHILSLSDFEGSHQAVAEGMLAGCIPAIRGWKGAGLIYPLEFIGGDIDDVFNIVIDNSEPLRYCLAKRSAYDRACDDFSFERTTKEIVNLILTS